MLKKTIKGILFSFIVCCSLGNVYAQDGMKITKLGSQGTKYTVNFTGKKAMISRDGSFATPITSGTEITLPGKYYVCIETDKGMQIQSFIIENKKASNHWTVKREGELDEILKYALENHLEEIVLDFHYGEFSIDTMQMMLQEHMQALLLTYPALTYTGGIIEQVGSSQPTVTIKFKYPIKSIENMRNYDRRAFEAVEAIIEEYVACQMGAFEREEALLHALTQQITYSERLINEAYITNATAVSHTMWGALLEGEAVCDGYAKSLMYSLNVVGVPSKIVTGTASGEDHAWNMVKLDNAYYHVDLTWSDQDKERIGVLPKYFNELDTYMAQTHQWNRTKYPSTSETTYCAPFAPIQEKGIYKVQSKRELENILSCIKNEQLSMGTLVLYDLSKNEWDKEQILSELSHTLGKGLCYTVESKYNTLIIDYKIKL